MVATTRHTLLGRSHIGGADPAFGGPASAVVDEDAFKGSGARLLSFTVIPVVIVELVLVLGSVWLARRSSSWTSGAAVAGAVAAVFILLAAAVTI